MSLPPSKSIPPPRPFSPIELENLFGVPVVFLKLPPKSKKPLGKWKHLKTDDMTPSYLAGLKGANVAVVLGDVSGGICAIDIDDDKFVGWILNALPVLADTFQTFGSRGRVFWIRCKGNSPRSFKFKSASGEPIGEFRSNGNYSVAHGIHPNGNAYRWLVKKPVVEIASDIILTLKPKSLGDSALGENALGDSPIGGIREGAPLFSMCRGVGGVASVGVSSLGLVISDEAKAEINRAVELGVENLGNNRASFYACLALIQIRGIENLSSLTIAEKRYFAERWFQRLQESNRVTKTKAHYLTDIFNSIKNAKRNSNMNPIDKNPIPQAWINAQTEPLPAEAESFAGDETMQHLIALCYQLHLLSAKGEWYLARDKAGKTIGLDSNATRNLGDNFFVLVELGILEVIKPHDKEKHQATRYRYIEQGGVTGLGGSL